MMSRLMLNLHGSAFARNELLSTGPSDGTESSDNTTSLLFTSRISMPHHLFSTATATAWDPEASQLHRESAYVRDLRHSGRDGGYIEEVYELADYHRGHDDESGHLRVPLREHGDVEIGKPIVGGREYYD